MQWKTSVVKEVLDVFWTTYKRSIYALGPGVRNSNNYFWKKINALNSFPTNLLPQPNNTFKFFKRVLQNQAPNKSSEVFKIGTPKNLGKIFFFWCSYVLKLSKMSILRLVLAIFVQKTFKKPIFHTLVCFDFPIYILNNDITALFSS